MKNLYFFIFCFALLNGCTITLYDGNIYPSKVEFNEPNFAYLKTIRGSSEAKYSTSGWDEKKVDGLINEAKTNMYSKHNFGANQIAANITVDYLKEGEPNSRLNGSPSLRKIRVVMTADVFQFYNDINEIQPILNQNLIDIESIEDIPKKNVIIDKTKLDGIEIGDIVYYKKTDGKMISCKVKKLKYKKNNQLNFIEVEYTNSKSEKVNWKIPADYYLYYKLNDQYFTLK